MLLHEELRIGKGRGCLLGKGQRHAPLNYGKPLSNAPPLFSFPIFTLLPLFYYVVKVKYR